MEINFIKYPEDNDWLNVRNAALTTQRKNSDIIPSSKLREKFLLAEHSPIRILEYIWEWIDIPSWVSVHIVRHHEGITHFVSSQRNDIQKEYDRTKAPQDAPVNHRCIANAQSLINVSKARTCMNASLETRQVWKLLINSLKEVSPELSNLCVPPCIYRNGICPEVFKHCGYNQTAKFEQECKIYRDRFEQYYKGGK
jgi:thymidylate synthase ThyX